MDALIKSLRLGKPSDVKSSEARLPDPKIPEPRPAELESARHEVAAALAGLAPPCPDMAVAVGGSATSLGRVAGPVLDATSLERALAVLAGEPAAAVADRFLIDPQRARLLPAGLLILHGASRLLETNIQVGRGGIREGVLLEALRA